MLITFRAAIIKEFRLLTRDVHGVGLLFLLPLAFILIMSLALQDAFASRAGKGLEVVVMDLDRTTDSEQLIERLNTHQAFQISHAEQSDLETALKDSDAMFAISVPEGYGDTILDAGSEADPVYVLVSPNADKRTEMIFVSAIRESLGRHKVDAMLSAIEDSGGDEDAFDSEALDTPVTINYAFTASSDSPPSSVQQNVPAWLVFAIFFVAIPFSNTFITERNLGVQRRLLTTRMGPFAQFAGKLVPYFALNMLQVALMFAAGAFLVPLLGGDALQLRGSPIALILLSACISLAALSLALVISVMAGTSEQATLTSGIGNIVLAALGGVMVPRFIMPQSMQKLSDISPMAWGLDGYLELLLRDGELGDILSQLVKLCVFSCIMLGIAVFMHRRSTAL
ncbi:MAG: ABC transporter [Hirschia sp.]|nr:ABC transporter [Hirschia sp.]MBF18083.1 ABC transporter [Hirschia sp.]